MAYILASLFTLAFFNRFEAHFSGPTLPPLRAGISREVAKKISGHKTDSAYRRSNIVDNRDNEDAEKKLTKFLKGQA